MAGKAHDVEPHGLHVDLRRAGRLRGVYNHERAHRMSHSRHTRNVNGIASHVSGMRHHDGTRTRRHQALKLVIVEHAVGIASGMLDGHTLLRCQSIERT